MIYLGIFFFLIFGLIIGSFLNVVILRLNTGKGINGRSECLNCCKKLHWHELIPVVSFIFLKRRCSECGSKISWQYPLVELFTSMIFVLTFINQLNYLYDYIFLGVFNILILLIIWSLLIVIFVYDLKHTIIPNKLVYTFSLLSFVYVLVNTPYDFWFRFPYYLNIFSGFIFFIPFFCFWFFSRGKWMGLGDGKLVLGIGFLLGFVSGLSALILSFWLGAIIAIFLLLMNRLNTTHYNITIKSEIPFGPFLIVSTLLLFFLPFDVLGITLLFNF